MDQGLDRKFYKAPPRKVIKSYTSEESVLLLDNMQNFTENFWLVCPDGTRLNFSKHSKGFWYSGALLNLYALRLILRHCNSYFEITFEV